MKKSIVAITLSMLSFHSYAQDFMLSSSAVQDGEQVQNTYVLNGSGCAGGNISPELTWSGAPASTKSFAVTMFDSDAPTGSGWWHWTMVNIPKDVQGLVTGAGNKDGSKVPSGAIQGRTDFGGPGYGGPCPPAGDETHHYHFKVWALDIDHLPIDAESSGALVGYMLRTHSIASAELVAISKR